MTPTLCDDDRAIIQQWMDGREQEPASANAVAELVLSGIQDQLPRTYIGDRSTRPDFPVSRLADHVSPAVLFGVEWASAPGYSSPSIYYATRIPGEDLWIITISNDSPEMSEYCDLALGAVRAPELDVEAIGVLIRRSWEESVEPWERLLGSGSIDEETVEAWATQVWDAGD